MKIVHKELQIQSEYENQIINLDHLLNNAIKNEQIVEGLLNVFVPGSTGGITTIEYESGLISDLPVILDKLVPPDGSGFTYQHNVLNGDDNGHSHIRASIIGPSISIPISEGKINRGIWQNVVFLELDTRPRRRRLILTIIGQ